MRLKGHALDTILRSPSRPRLYRAVCRCGWKSDPAWRVVEVREDYQDHLAYVVATSTPPAGPPVPASSGPPWARAREWVAWIGHQAPNEDVRRAAQLLEARLAEAAL